MRPIFFIVAILFSTITLAQSSLIVFSEMGEPFTATLNGEVLNDQPSARVEKHEITQEMGKLVIRFEDVSKGIINKNFFFEPNIEYVSTVKLSKKGKYVLRMVSTGPVQQQELEATRYNTQEPTQYTTMPGDASSQENVEISGQETHNENISIQLEGMGISMNVETTSTTQLVAQEETSVSTSSTMTMEETTASHTTGNCGFPTSDTDFETITRSITSKNFEDSKLSIAQEIAENKCLTSTQIKKVMELFTYEETRLDFAKFAYTHCFDPDNYYQVYDAFTFESSIDELKNHVNSL